MLQKQDGLAANTESGHDDIMNQETNKNNDGTLVISFESTQGTDGSSESEYVDATQVVNFVPKTLLDERFKDQVTDFLKESCENMAEMDDPGVDLFQQKDFQLVTSKKRRNKKPNNVSSTRLISGPKNLTL